MEERAGSPAVRVGLAVALAAVLLALLARLTPIDYGYFASAVRAWLEGRSQLYDAAALDFYYLPWSLWVLLPLQLVPDSLGMAVLDLGSLVALGAAMVLLGSPTPGATQEGRWWLGAGLALVNPYTIWVLVIGQWDFVLLGAAALGWWAVNRKRPWLAGLALVGMSTKPTHMLLPLLLLLWGLRTTRPADWLKVAALPTAALLWSFVIAGVDWPLRWLDYVRTYPPRGYDISWSHNLGRPAGVAIALAGATAWLAVVRRRLADPATWLSSLLVGLLLAAFVVPYHYVLASPALPRIATRSAPLAVGAWLIGCIVLVPFATRAAPELSHAYPLALLLGLVWVERRAVAESAHG